MDDGGKENAPMLLSQKFLEKSVAAIISSIEIYNKPVFMYRTEAFCTLCINAWELLIKAKLLERECELIEKLYCQDKNDQPKISRSGIPCTIDLMTAYKRLSTLEEISQNGDVRKNLEALIEYRDCATHSVIDGHDVEIVVQKLGTANVQNYFNIVKRWFPDYDLSKYNFYLMPLSFFSQKKNNRSIVLSENCFLSYIENLHSESDDDDDEKFMIEVDVHLKSVKKIKKLADTSINQDFNAPRAAHVEYIGIPDKYKSDYKDLLEILKNRYENFCRNKNFHEIMKKLNQNTDLCFVNKLNPRVEGKGSEKKFYSHDILNALDKHYTLKR